MRTEGTLALITRRRPFGRVLFSLVTLVFGLGTLLVSDQGSSAAIIEGVSLTTAFSNLGVVTPGVVAQGTVTISNSSSRDITDAVVSVIAATSDVSTIPALDNWLASSATDRGRVVGSADVGDVSAGQTVTTPISLDPGLTGWSGTWGTRALLVTLEEGDGVVAREHNVVIFDAGVAPHAARLAVIAPVVVPSDISATIDPKVLEEATASDGALSRITAVAQQHPLTLAIDPRVPASILGQPDATPRATAWWQDLEKRTPPAFATAFGDADLSGQIQAGATSFLSAGQSDPDETVAQLLGGLGPSSPPIAPTSPGSATTSPTTSPTPSPYPADETWWSRLSGTAWPAAGTADTATMTALLNAGYKRAIVSSANLESSSGGVRGNIAPGLPVIITDDPLSTSITRAASRDGAFEANVASALARLATASTDPGSPHAAVAALSRDPESHSVDHLERLMNVLAGVSWVDVVPFDAITEANSGELVLRESREDEARLETVRSLLERHRSVVDFSVIGETPELISEPVTRQVMTTLGVGNINTPRWPAAVDASTESMTRTLNGVHLATGSVINMIGSTASLPLSIENDLMTTVSVVVYAVPRNSRLTVEGGLPVKVESRAQAVAKLPAVARVSNGSVFVDVSLTSEAGLPVGSSRPVNVEIRADWETIGLIVLGAVFLGLVGAGIFRTVRRRRAEVP